MAATAKPQAPLFTKRALFTLIWPLLLEQTLSVTMGMADTLMVSGVGEAAVSSVSLVDSLNILIIQILSALATGGAVIASQYLGRKDEENASHSAAQLYSVLGISTITVGVVCMLLSRPILRGVFGSIDATSCGLPSSISSSVRCRIPSSGCTTAARRCSGRRATAASVCWQAWS